MSITRQVRRAQERKQAKEDTRPIRKLRYAMLRMLPTTNISPILPWDPVSGFHDSSVIANSPFPLPYASCRRKGLLSNKPLLGAVLFTFVLQLATIYLSFLNPIFKTEPLTFSELLLTMALSTGVFWAV